MKVPYSWLMELAPTTQPINELSESLSIAGFEVESLQDFSLNAQGVLVGFIENVSKHPQADKLSICEVNVGKESTLQIVCGAQNVRSKTHVIVATIGGYLGAINLKIKSTELRGVKSDGMICSLNEIGVNSDLEGIAVLEDMNIEIPSIGSDILKLFGLDELVLDLAITANRPDGMSINGIAREVSALTECQIKLPTIENKKYETKNYKIANKCHSIIDELGIYSITQISNILGDFNTPSLITKRLNNCGIKSINTIVDLTNYVMLEQGQPLHAFDADKLHKLTGKEVNYSSFGIRKAKELEEIKLLDGKSYKLDQETSVITCFEVPIAVAGVMGGYESSVTKETKNIFLEGAVFTAASVRNSVRQLGLRTESSSRYEKGISSKITVQAVSRFFDLLRESFQFDTSYIYVDGYSDFLWPEVTLRRSRIDKILGRINQSDQNTLGTDHGGYFISDKIVSSKLKLIGCEIEYSNNNWLVKIPPHREKDIFREIDLIEEIARLIGYDCFQNNLPNPIQPGGLNAEQRCERKLRQFLSGAGLQEVTTMSLVSKSIEDENRIAITNPLLSDTSHLRTNLWEEHLNIVLRNRSSGKDCCWIYEIGTIYQKCAETIEENKILAGVLNGVNRYERWSTNGKLQPLDYYEARGKLNEALASLNINLIDQKLNNDSLLHPGRSANLIIEGKIAGKFGQIHPQLAEKYNITLDTYIFELSLKSILKACTRKNKLNPIFKQYPTVPSMERDLSLVVDKRCQAAEVVSLIKKSGRPLLENVELIDRYEGNNLEQGKASLTFRIRYRDPKRTLQDVDVNPVHEKIRSVIVKQLGASLRS